MFRQWFLYSFLLLLLVGLSSCAGPAPIEEYSLAREALEAARTEGAPGFSPGYWHKAEEYYRKAEEQYRDRYYNDARAFFNKARRYSEKAENATRIKKHQSGGDFP